MTIKNRQCTSLVKIITTATILVQFACTVVSCEPGMVKKQGETVAKMVENPGGTFTIALDASPEIVQVSSQQTDYSDDTTDYFSDKYVLLSNEFHRILEEDAGQKALCVGRLQFLLSSARDFEQRATRIQKQYWVRQFKVLSTSLEVAIELSQARTDRDEHKKTHEDK